VIDTQAAHEFERFGLEHLTAIAAVLATGFGLSVLTRRSRNGGAATAIRYGVAGFLLVGLFAATASAWSARPGDWIDMLPLHLCDMAIFIAVWSLIRRSQTGYEVLYFWAFGGTLFALITPDIERAFPDFECVSFFALHGAVLVAAILLTVGCGLRPRPRANLRVWALTNAYAALVGVIDAVSGRNYLYLRHKPYEPSILDQMGPWPWYIGAADVFALALFTVLMLPFGVRGAAAGRASRSEVA